MMFADVFSYAVLAFGAGFVGLLLFTGLMDKLRKRRHDRLMRELRKARETAPS